ncbi:chalcone isomerase family protein [Bordetella holmesii]|uniref:Chalcone-flavanone isomerase family protein n=2 Tax=Bordetella holmesii TaxID=35814 RepID=A0ABN0RW32_9BORD|nr:chalcone isomerase family protein [Bordetella holmesii]AHV92048.1 chalcone-flavanone isomerase family protein [Bordetella holmesii ATCC 51541]AIT27441.1 chalcone-flavanone isomerase family protein [Bordetella holmesii 44057]EWM42666.1 chalcone-flavanone isomerase family protein [Bordetella holmesii 41130]EWM48032.1 chalcone-flavanone isomerase family protein [Bordetella holmesii 35009]EWM49013.1 chalcone-flavanone isomerase family protein [Bordetella holmesii 70147]
MIDVEGVPVAQEINQAGQTLRLVGAGVHTKFVFRIYLAALYASDPHAAPNQLIEGPGARRLHLQMLRDIDSVALGEAMRGELVSTDGANGTRALAPSVERLSHMLNTIDHLREGDTIDLELEGTTVDIVYNRQDKGRIQDPLLPAALMRVWLGDTPTQASLKQALLGLH